MENSDIIKKANEFASEALERIQKEGLPPTPQNYELWYTYVAETNPEICRAIDILEANGEAITDEHCQEIYERFLSQGKENEQVREAGDKIKATIKDVTGMVTNVKDATSKYSEALTEASGQLSGDALDQEQLQGVLQNVVSNTQNMIEQNAQLEEQLNRSSSAMEELKRDLEHARKEAMTDSLTNLANRKAFDTEIVRVKKTAEEEDLIFSLLLMDIDHFKSFNDNFGHQVGDQVLRLVAKTLKDGVKGRDVPTRYGGEEFAIILPETPLQAAINVGDQLRKAVASKDIVNRNTGEKLGRITLSGGCAEAIPGESIEDLIERADAALYTAKHNGRNQIASASAPGQKKAG